MIINIRFQILSVILCHCFRFSFQNCVIFDFDDPKPHQNFASLQSTVLLLEPNSTVTVITPGYNIDQHYPNNIICSWIIQSRQSLGNRSTNSRGLNHPQSPIKVHFEDFLLESSFHCALDSLWLFVGKTLSQSSKNVPNYQFCGSILPEDQFYNTSIINLVFITDSHRNFRGFNISFSLNNTKDATDSRGNGCVDHLTQFSCSNGNCVNSSMVCNEIDDCHDGSDENECQSPVYSVIYNTSMGICPSVNKLKGRFGIIGGTTSTPNAWPWQVSLRMRLVSLNSNHNDQWNHICGAILINYSTALTAAHCFHSKHLNLTKYSLAFGEYKLDDESAVNQLITRYPRKIIIHPDYHLNGVNGKEDDIALIKLNYPVKNLNHIKPVCIHNWTSFHDLPKYGFVTGWSQGLSNAINVLSEVRLPLISGSQCYHYYGDDFFVNSDKIICAGQKEGHKDSCKGDSGGPLVVNINGNWSLIGLVSSGSGCGLPNKPGIYTNIAYYIDWILKTERESENQTQSVNTNLIKNTNN